MMTESNNNTSCSTAAAAATTTGSKSYHQNLQSSTIDLLGTQNLQHHHQSQNLVHQPLNLINNDGQHLIVKQEIVKTDGRPVDLAKKELLDQMDETDGLTRSIIPRTIIIASCNENHNDNAELSPTTILNSPEHQSQQQYFLSRTNDNGDLLKNSSVSSNSHHQLSPQDESSEDRPSPPLPPSAAAVQLQQSSNYSRLQNVVVASRSNTNSPTHWNQPISQAPISVSQHHIHHAQHCQPQHQQQNIDSITNHQQLQQSSYGMLRHENDILYIAETCIDIGRNSSTSSVHFHVAKNSFVSRKHFQVIYDVENFEFYLICLSKNGVFVDDVFQRRSSEALKLTKRCTFRFPSTDIRILFENFMNNTTKSQNTANNSNNLIKTNNFNSKNLIESSSNNVIYSPLKISIPKTEQKSPFPSPTGTMSAANSCPTSPRQGFQEYQNYNNYNNNNNNNNNNNSLQNELFHPPSNYSNEHEKPPYSYAQLIVQSISASPDKQLTLSGIYSFISKHYPYYRKEINKGWQNSIRHNLSLNRYFIKVARSQDEPGKGSFWRIDPNSEAKLIDQSYKKRRQRGSQCFRPPYLPRSAPVSPSHIDNSRENSNSPLHDIILQSAPGSPGMSYHADSHIHEDSFGSTSNIIQQLPYNMHSQFNSPYHVGNQSNLSAFGSTTSGIGVGAGSGTIQQKRSHHQSNIISSGGSGGGGGGGGGGSGSTGDIYDEMPDYSDSECDSSTVKRTKYSSNEV